MGHNSKGWKLTPIILDFAIFKYYRMFCLQVSMIYFTRNSWYKNLGVGYLKGKFLSISHLNWFKICKCTAHLHWNVPAYTCLNCCYNVTRQWPELIAFRLCLSQNLNFESHLQFKYEVMNVNFWLPYFLTTGQNKYFGTFFLILIFPSFDLSN